MTKKLQIGILLIGLIIAAFTVTLALAQDTPDALQLDRLARQAMSGAARSFNAQEIISSDIVIQGNWAFGMTIAKMPDGQHGEPDFRLFIAQRTSAGWQLALEYTPTFYEWVANSPAGLISLGARTALLQANPADPARATRGIASARLSLPFARGETWTFVGGPHGNNGDSVRPWTAVDLTLPDFVTSGAVRAAREGWVWRSSQCPNYVRVDHADGWQTGYYHVKNERVTNGQYVERGQQLGETSSLTGCGGWSSGPHVHFTLKQNGSYVNIAGHDIGGWTIQEGNAAYEGCARRVRDGYTVCRPYGQVYNDGSIGSGTLDLRYDINADKRQDVWAVNMRDGSTNSTAVYVASGTNVTSLITARGTGMPQQPAYLNTAFAAGDYNGDTVPDLWVIHRLDGSGKTAFRVMNGANLSYLLADQITALPPFDNSTAFAVMDYNRDEMPDLWAITPRDPNSSGVRVQIISGRNPSSVLANVTTSLPKTNLYADVNFAAADYNADGYPDLWAIYPRDASGNVRIHIISGRNWTNTLKNTQIPIGIQPTNITNYGFMVGDYNNDSYPDIWHIDRRTSVVTVVSGSNFTNVFFSSPSALPNSNSQDWHIVGSDRSREAIVPRKPNIKALAPNSVITAPSYVIRFMPPGLAESMTVILRNAATGEEIGRYNFNDSNAHCNASVCRVNSTLITPRFYDGRKYSVQVIARNSYGESYGNTVPFTVELPGPVTLLEPANQSIVNTADSLTFTFKPSPYATRYIFHTMEIDGVSYKFSANYGAADICIADVCTITLSPAPQVGNYLWRVVARDGLGGSSNSIRHFYTVVPADPTVTPTDGTAAAVIESEGAEIVPTPTPPPVLDDGTIPLPPPPETTAQPEPEATPTPFSKPGRR